VDAGRAAGHPWGMKILLVDDHALIREALRGVLKELKPEAVVLEASNGRHALQLVDEHADLTLIMLDLNLPDSDGAKILVELRKRYPEISVVILSAHHDRNTVMKALDGGAAGFIPKSAPREIMVGALSLIFSGGVYIPSEVLADRPAPAASKIRPGLRGSPADLGLTDRQIEVLALLMQGKSNKAICRTLGLAEHTVKNYVTAILKALNVTNRTEAVIAVAALGWDLSAVPDR
jgi:DNA-binding NarL/FixJ family response regulator